MSQETQELTAEERALRDEWDREIQYAAPIGAPRVGPVIRTEDAPDAPPGNSIMDRSVCLVLNISVFGVKRATGMNQVQVNADKALLGLTKSLIDSPELRDVGRHDSETKASLAKLTLPSLFKKGVYMIPIGTVEEVDLLLQWRAAERRELIEKFLGVYLTKVESARGRLRDYFKDSDYPPLSVVQERFGFSYRYFTFASPGKLKGLSKALFDREAEKARVWAEDAQENIQAALREAMAELVNHLVERLTGADDGKKKTFKNATITNLQEFLDRFAKMNIAQDGELTQLVAQAKDLIGGVEPESLRVSETVRDKVQGGFTQIKSQLDALMINRPTRRFLLEEDGEASCFR